MSSSAMEKLDSRQDILAMAITTGVAHELHEQAQVLWGCWEHADLKVEAEVEPLSNLGQHIGSRRLCKPEPLRAHILLTELIKLN